MSFTPSRYQQAILDFLLRTVGKNLFVEAVAGSGKTSTLELICRAILEKHAWLLKWTIFVAFSKEIQIELSRRLPSGLWVRTFHSFAMYNLRQALGTVPENWIDDKKYSRLIGDLLDRQNRPEGPERDLIFLSLSQSVRFARLTLVDLSDPEAFDAMLAHYDISPVEDLLPMTKSILQRGEDTANEVIDYTDMIYLPIRMNIPLRRFKLVMVDEAQDLSACQRELTRRMVTPDGRIIFVGDRNQAIFGFAGAEVDSVDRIVDEFECKVLPLSVCYRCPSSHLDMARTIVPQIEDRPDAPAGIVNSIAYDRVSEHVDAKKNDLIICRTNAPLVDMAFSLIAEGIPATIKGRDLMEQLVALAKATMKLHGANWEQFHTYLGAYVQRQTESLKKRKDTEMQIQSLQDRAEALGVIVARAQALDHRISTINGLEKFIERLYGPENGSVVLCSAHKAKGLEANRVFLLGPEDMPHRMATSAWAIAQEHNLRYVAFTRAKEMLVLVPLPARK